MGGSEFVAARVAKRIADEKLLLNATPEVPDLQSAWVILLKCAGPRCNHLIRTLPPSRVAQYAKEHDEAMWGCAERLLGIGEECGVCSKGEGTSTRPRGPTTTAARIRQHGPTAAWTHA